MQIVATKNRIANVHLVFLVGLRTNILDLVDIIYIIYMKGRHLF